MVRYQSGGLQTNHCERHRHRVSLAVVADLSIREMCPADSHIKIDYFHSCSGEMLDLMGIDGSLLPTRADWMVFYEEDALRPIDLRRDYSLLWLLDDEAIGFSSVNNIEFGVEANMHLHMAKPSRRAGGLGKQFVRLSTERYFNVLDLQRIYVEPKATNVPPNRVAQATGFRYVQSRLFVPGLINTEQITTQWVLDRPTTSV